MSDKPRNPSLHVVDSRTGSRREASRAEHVHEVLDTFQRTLQGIPSQDYLVYATGLLLGVRDLLVTMDEWQRWGACAAELLAARCEADAKGETR